MLQWSTHTAPRTSHQRIRPLAPQVINDALRRWKESRVEARRNQVYEARQQMEKQWSDSRDGEDGGGGDGGL